MKNYIIFNGVALYSEAQIPLEILKSNTSEIIRAMIEKKGDNKYIVVHKNDNEIIKMLEEQIGLYPDHNIQIIKGDARDAFVYANSTALKKVIEGEKAIPQGIDNDLQVYTFEGLLDSELKKVLIQGGATGKTILNVNKKIKPRDILDKYDYKGKFKAMYLGFPMGRLISEEELDEEVDLTTDFISIFGEEECILDKLAYIGERYLRESCGHCVFGYEGTSQINMILSDIINKKGKTDDIDLLLELCTMMKDQSICEVGVAAANTVLTSINNFRLEIEEHITKKNCKAGVCKKFVTYHILPDKCTGCNECQEYCDDDAILGKKRLIHVIDQDECTQCGKCVEACDEGAIVKAGRIKPKGPAKPIPCKR